MTAPTALVFDTTLGVAPPHVLWKDQIAGDARTVPVSITVADGDTAVELQLLIKRIATDPDDASTTTIIRAGIVETPTGKILQGEAGGVVTGTLKVDSASSLLFAKNWHCVLRLVVERESEDICSTLQTITVLPSKFAKTTNGSATGRGVPAVVVVTPSSCSGTPGGTHQLTAAVTDINGDPVTDPAPTWESHNPLVASVDQSGLVTFITPGVATISAICGPVSGAATATCNAIGFTGHGYFPVLDTETGVVATQYDYSDVKRWIPETAGLSVATVTDQLLNAIVSVGVGGSLRFPVGQIYTIDKSLTPLTAQYWDFGACTLRRCDEIVDTTTTPIVAGQLANLVVQHPERFRIGQTVTVQSISNPDTRTTQQQLDGVGVELNHHTISSIVGSTLHLNGTWLNSFPSGGTVVVVFSMIAGQDAPNVSIRGGGNYNAILDGNSANNLTLQRWELNNTVDLDSDNGSIFNLTSIDSTSDAFIMLGDNFQFGQLRIFNAQGNGTHLGSTPNWQAHDIFISGANLGGPSVGHYSAGFAYSVACGKGQLTNLYVENAKSVFGPIFLDSDSDGTFVNVVGKDCTTFLDMTCSDTKAGRIQLIGFRAENCGLISLVESSGLDATMGPYRIKLAHGELLNTRLSANFAKHVTITDVTVDLTGDTTTNPVAINNVTDFRMVNCTVIGGAFGIVIAGLCRGVKLDVHCKEQQTYAISGTGLTSLRAGSGTITITGGAGVGTFSTSQAGVVAVGSTVTINHTPYLVAAFDGTTGATLTGAPNVAAGAFTTGVGSTGIVVNGANITNTSAADAGYIAIKLGNGMRVTDTDVILVKGACGLQFPNGGIFVTGGVADNNRIRTVTGTPCAQIFGGAKNNTFRTNYYVIAIANSATPGDNVVDGNMPMDTTAAIDSASIPPVYRFPLYGWQQLTTVAASQAKVALTDLEGGPLGRYMQRAGVVNKFGYYFSAAPTADSAQIILQISADKGVTWTDFFDSLGTTQMRLFTSIGVIDGTYSANAPLTFPYPAACRFRFAITTTGLWAPTANDLRAWLEVIQ